MHKTIVTTIINNLSDPEQNDWSLLQLLHHCEIGSRAGMSWRICKGWCQHILERADGDGSTMGEESDDWHPLNALPGAQTPPIRCTVYDDPQDLERNLRIRGKYPRPWVHALLLHSVIVDPMDRPRLVEWTFSQPVQNRSWRIKWITEPIPSWLDTDSRPRALRLQHGSLIVIGDSYDGPRHCIKSRDQHHTRESKAISTCDCSISY